MVDPDDADPRCRLAVEAQDVASRDPEAQLLSQQRYLIGGQSILQTLLQVLIGLQVGQKPQQLTLRHGASNLQQQPKPARLGLDSSDASLRFPGTAGAAGSDAGL